MKTLLIFFLLFISASVCYSKGDASTSLGFILSEEQLNKIINYLKNDDTAENVARSPSVVEGEIEYENETNGPKEDTDSDNRTVELLKEEKAKVAEEDTNEYRDKVEIDHLTKSGTIERLLAQNKQSESEEHHFSANKDTAEKSSQKIEIAIQSQTDKEEKKKSTSWITTSKINPFQDVSLATMSDQTEKIKQEQEEKNTNETTSESPIKLDPFQPISNDILLAEAEKIKEEQEEEKRRNQEKQNDFSKNSIDPFKEISTEVLKKEAEKRLQEDKLGANITPKNEQEESNNNQPLNMKIDAASILTINDEAVISDNSVVAPEDKDKEGKEGDKETNTVASKKDSEDCHDCRLEGDPVLNLSDRIIRRLAQKTGKLLDEEEETPEMWSELKQLYKYMMEFSLMNQQYQMNPQPFQHQQAPAVTIVNNGGQFDMTQLLLYSLAQGTYRPGISYQSNILGLNPYDIDYNADINWQQYYTPFNRGGIRYPYSRHTPFDMFYGGNTNQSPTYYRPSTNTPYFLFETPPVVPVPPPFNNLTAL